MSEKGGFQMAECPECEKMIVPRKGIALGECLHCPECSTLLEVISLEPLDLDYALGYEDWEEETMVA